MSGWRDEEVPSVSHVVLVVAFQDALLTIPCERVLGLKWYRMETLRDQDSWSCTRQCHIKVALLIN